MEAEKILVNEETVENVAEEVVQNGSCKAMKAFGIVGGLVLVGGLAYKYAIKPAIEKRRAVQDILDEDFEEGAVDTEIVEEDSEEN